MNHSSTRYSRSERNANNLRNICIYLPALSIILLTLRELGGSADAQQARVLFLWDAAPWVTVMAYSAALATFIVSAGLRAGENSPLLADTLEQIRDDALVPHLWLCALVFWASFSMFDSSLGPGAFMKIMWLCSGAVGCLTILLAVFTTIFVPMGLLREDEDGDKA